jgi:glycerophosphoryl diester phosphodiesterase
MKLAPVVLIVSLAAGLQVPAGLPDAQGAIAPIITSNPFRTGRTLVIPHAGGDALYPENTLYAYERSSAMGGDVIDADVAMTADGVLVAFHDATLDRTTNGSGRLRDRTFAQLAALDAAWHFRKGGLRGKNIRIPTIEAILRRFPRSLVTLDLKDQRIAAVRPICDLLVRLDRFDDVYVGVDVDAQVIEFRRTCPAVRTSGTSADRQAARVARERNDSGFMPRQMVNQPAYRARDGTKRITKDYLTYAHSRNAAVFTWVVDDAAELRELIRLGVDGIYTRRPDVMLSVLRTVDLGAPKPAT